VVLQVGEINPRKGQLDTLQAAALVHRSHPDARFVFVGTERCHDDYRQALRTAETAGGLSGAVTWLGPREDVARLLPHATIAILPSHQESFSLAGLEAMACGVPLVATNVGGFPEMVQDGVTALLVPPHHPAALAAAIDGLLADPARRATLGAAARNRALADFSPESHITRLGALLADGTKV
jgi:starch synthase